MNNPTIPASSLVLSALLVACSLGGCADSPPDVNETLMQRSPIGAGTDFKLMTAQQVIQLLDNSESIYLEPVNANELEALGDASDKVNTDIKRLENNDGYNIDESAYNKCINRQNGQDQCAIFAGIFPNGWHDDTLANAKLHTLPVARQYYEAQFIGCTSDERFQRNCEYLFLAFVSIGNYDAARAVLVSNYCARSTRIRGMVDNEPLCWQGFYGLDDATRGQLFPSDSDRQELTSTIGKLCNDDHYAGLCYRYQLSGGVVDQNGLAAARLAEKQQDEQHWEEQRQEKHDAGSQSNSTPTQTTQTVSNPTLDAVKVYAAEHAGNNSYAQPHSPPNIYQASILPSESHSAHPNSQDSFDQLYFGPDLQHCVTYFFDSGSHLNFKNNCNQPVTVTYTYFNAPDANPASFNLGPGATDNEWGNPTGKYVYRVCPAAFPLVVDTNRTPPYDFADMQKQLSCMRGMSN